MKNILFIVLAGLLVSCGSSVSPTSVENYVTPFQVVKGMYSALNNGDIGRAMSFFSDEAVYIVRNGPEKGIYIGKDEIRPLLEPEIKNKITSVMSDLEFATNIVGMEHKRIQNAEAISSEIQIFAVIDGKITGVGIDPASLVRFLSNALNENKVDRALSLFADSPVCTFVSNDSRAGKSALKNAFQKYVDAGDIFEATDIDATEYYKVEWTLKVYDPRGKVIAESQRLSHVESGKILDCVPVK